MCSFFTWLYYLLKPIFELTIFHKTRIIRHIQHNNIIDIPVQVVYDLTNRRQNLEHVVLLLLVNIIY